MKKYFTSVAVIPARGGSKRIPRKNLYPIKGKPMLGWVIETALAADVFDEIVVSSEDDEILETAKSYGAKPHLRPNQLADDMTHVGAAVDEYIETMIIKPDTVCLLYATAILLPPKYLKQCYELLNDPSVGSVLSITEFESPIQRAYLMSEDQSIKMENPEFFNWRTQDLPKRYHDAGCFSWWKLDRLTTQRSTGLNLPKQFAVDIDSMDDLHIATALHLASGYDSN
jgi:pseudaminic acid cytidylyltransferase